MAKNTVILLGFICLKFFLQYVLISPEYDLQRDEYLHLDQANHLAWGYLSVPPVTSWISYLIGLLGNSVFWVKFFPALFGALSILVVWKTIETLGGNLFALALGASCVLFSVLLRLNILYQPNSLDVLCWTGFYFAVIRYFQTEKPKWLYIGAVVFAFGFLNKYNILFLALGLLPAILVTPQRKVLANRSFYLAALLALLLVLPNLVWQYQHNFPVFHHLRELSEIQLVHVDRWGFLKGQVLFFIGSLFVILAGLYALIAWKPLQKYRPFFWSFFFTLIIFLYFRAKDYYAIGLYPIYLAFGSVFLAHAISAGRKKYLQPVAIAIPLLFFIPLYQVAFPNKSPEYILHHQENYKALGLLRWEDGKDHPLPQDFADMLGWQELALKVDKLYASLPEPAKTLVLCDNYGQAGAINYYSKKGVRAVSFNADYVNWFELDREYRHLVRVISFDVREAESKETGSYFLTYSKIDSIANPYARESGTTIYSFTESRVNINEIIREEIEAVKNHR